MKCKLSRELVGYFNATIMVNNEFGRSLASSSLFHVTSAQNLYNYMTYAGR